MSQDRRGSTATATVGLAGVAGGSALAERGLRHAYTATGSRRPRLLPQRVVRHTHVGRGKILTGTAMSLAAAPAAIQGIYELTNKREGPKREPFLVQGVHGAQDALAARVETQHREKAPKKVVATNAAIGLGAGLAGAEGASRILGHVPSVRHMRYARAGLAGAAGVGAAAATLPLQNKLVNRSTRGKYEVTPAGVRRKKRPVVRPSSRATVLDQRVMGPAAFRSQTVASKRDIGASMSPATRRAMVTAAGAPVPVIGDIAQAGMAGKLAPPGRVHRDVAEQYVGSAGGGTAGQVVGAGGALALASRHQGFERQANALNARVEGAKANIKAKVPVKLPGGGGLKAKVAERTPQRVLHAGERLARTGVVRAVRARPGVAAAGALVGGAIGGAVGSQGAYSHILRADDRYRAAHAPSNNAHGSRVVKLETGKPLTRREKKVLASRKEHSAALSATTGTLGLTALGTTLAASRHSPLKAAHRLHIGRATVPLLTTSAGLGGANSLIGAQVQRQEAKQAVAKFVLRPTGLPRTPSIRRGFVRQRRLASGLTSTATVRGGLA